MVNLDPGLLFTAINLGLVSFNENLVTRLGDFSSKNNDMTLRHTKNKYSKWKRFFRIQTLGTLKGVIIKRQTFSYN